MSRVLRLLAWGLLPMWALAGALVPSFADEPKEDPSLEWAIPRAKVRLPFDKEQPIVFVSTKSPEWKTLKSFWNPTTEAALDPITEAKVTRTVIKVKIPLGLDAPPVPLENPMTLQRWEIGRQLYFDTVLSSDSTVSCATCHDPKKGFTDQSRTSFGISKNKGPVNAPTVMNSAYNALQFWDGRAISLEDQSQGPPQNALEMFDGKGHAWNNLVSRVRKKGDYARKFVEAFGVEPNRDVIAKAIAQYERTVLNGNSIHDRAEQAMKVRVAEEESGAYTLKAQDYATVIKEALAAKDTTAIEALKVKEEGQVAKTAEQINHGRSLFFGKARCSLCHVGNNFSDGQFHNLGVGMRDGKIASESMGRYVRLPTGHKNPEMIGAFKTPTLRGLLATAPYMHDGEEKTLEDVVELYDRGGNANEFLSPKMRDLDAEKAYLKSKAMGTPYTGREMKLLGPDETPIAPMVLKLTPSEKSDLVMFLRSLQGETAAIVGDPTLPATK
ncbi:MAG: cytochrome C peroxidase [Gemmataceae bacterium]|nr:cytochrome C peroxidase [Gemmataceae bacterium]